LGLSQKCQANTSNIKKIPHVIVKQLRSLGHQPSESSMLTKRHSLNPEQSSKYCH
jgi:hypothetical protein